MTRDERERRGYLNGWFEAGCHQSTCFSTYHHMRDGVCQWCGRTEADISAAGAEWFIWPLPAPPVPQEEA